MNAFRIDKSNLLYFATLPLALLFLSSIVADNAMGADTEVAQWTRFEAGFTSPTDYDNPVQDVRVEVEFSGPDGFKQTVLAFWDGGKTWKVRFSPEKTGEWRYRTRCSETSDSGLHDQSGSFRCVPYRGDNVLYLRGSIGLSENRRYLTYADETPFFWLADTCWNGALLSTERDWETYLQDRVDKRFTVIQFVMTQWRMVPGDTEGRPAFTGKERIRVNPEFFQRMDRKYDAVNRHGLVAAPVLLWAIRGDDNPGYFLPEDQKIALAEYMVARYGAHQVIWILGGDGEYRDEHAETWRNVGRAVFGEDRHRLAVMHPNGRSWVGDEFRNESWVSFIGYQSGHGDDDGTLRWIVEGPPSENWDNEPILPAINMEPNYEGHNGYTHRKVHTDLAVRRAAYWSLLVSPPAGVTYGGQGVWGWHMKVQAPADHVSTGLGLPWYEAVDLDGAQQMKFMRDFFDSIEWWRLEPAQELVAEQPGEKDPHLYITAAKTKENDLAVVYVPENGVVTVSTDELKRPANVRWFHPLTGGWLDAGEIEESRQQFKAPDRNDWVLCIEAK